MLRFHSLIFVKVIFRFAAPTLLDRRHLIQRKLRRKVTSIQDFDLYGILGCLKGRGKIPLLSSPLNEKTRPGCRSSRGEPMLRQPQSPNGDVNEHVLTTRKQRWRFACKLRRHLQKGSYFVAATVPEFVRHPERDHGLAIDIRSHVLDCELRTHVSTVEVAIHRQLSSRQENHPATLPRILVGKPQGKNHRRSRYGPSWEMDHIDMSLEGSGDCGACAKNRVGAKECQRHQFANRVCFHIYCSFRYVVFCSPRRPGHHARWQAALGLTGNGAEGYKVTAAKRHSSGSLIALTQPVCEFVENFQDGGGQVVAGFSLQRRAELGCAPRGDDCL